ncbi:tetratricopeptide repeat protein [bacterium]|nr:MAG: tetratricopeptide repeat protein [bacterium]
MKALLSSKKLPFVLAGFLAIAVLLVYLRSSGFDFINLDDADYVTDSSLVKRGLTLSGVREAFTQLHQKLWAPMTQLTLMADSEFFGIKAGGFHRTNAILHSLNGLLFFLFLYGATKSPWKSFFAAALWALHPMRVESVAWVAERKDLVSGFFFLLCLLSYLEYAKNKKIAWYAASLLMMFLGYGAKPILVIMPLVLLAVDFWPLGRIGRENPKKLLLEKAPFFALSIVLSLATVFLLKAYIHPLGRVPLDSRAVSVATSYLHYLFRTVWPFDLVMQDRSTATKYTGVWFVAAVLALAAISLGAWRARKSSPGVLAGWFWYLTALFPVSGVVAVGLYMVADHFTYLPHMGVAIAAVWGIDALAGENHGLRKPLAALALFAVGFLSYLSVVQLSYWKNGLTFFSHNLSVTRSDAFSEKLLGNYYLVNDELDQAEKYLKSSLEKQPDDPATHLFMGTYLRKKERYVDAVASFMEMLALDPENLEAHYNIAFCAIKLKNYKMALDHAQRALDIDPQYSDALLIFGQVFTKTGRFDDAVAILERANGMDPGSADFYLAENAEARGDFPEAERLYKKALSLTPGDVGSNFNYGLLLVRLGRAAEARERFGEVLRASPTHPQAHLQLGLISAGEGNIEQALASFKEAVKKAPDDPAVNFNLALAASRLGRDELAREYYKKHLALVPNDAVSHYNLAALLIKAGDKGEAARHFEEVVRIDPSDEEARDWLRKLGR